MTENKTTLSAKKLPSPVLLVVVVSIWVAFAFIVNIGWSTFYIGCLVIGICYLVATIRNLW